MPLPKGIYSDPQVRRAWIGERKLILAEFDQMVALGSSRDKASRQLGFTESGIRRMRDSLDGLEARAEGANRKHRIDLGLALLSVLNPPSEARETLTTREVAAWCDCTEATIQRIERRAFAKLRGPLTHLRGKEAA